MTTPTPDWTALRQAVRGFVGSQVNTADHADDITQATMERLLGRAARGEQWQGPEAVAVQESKFARHEYYAQVKKDRQLERDARQILTPSRGKKAGAKTTKLVNDEGHRMSGVRLSDQYTGRGRPTKGSPRRRQPALILYPDGATAVLKQRQEQVRYQSKPATGTPSSLLFVVAYYEGLPPAPWEVSRELRLLGQALDRDRWRDAEKAIRAPRRGKR